LRVRSGLAGFYKVPDLKMRCNAGSGSWRYGTRRPGFEELFFAVNEGVDVVGGKLDVVTVGNGIGRASVNAVAAEDAAGIVNIIDAGVALPRGDAIGFVVFSGFDINTIRGARSCAKKATNAFLEAVFVALEYVNAAIARRDAGRHFRIALGGGFAKHRAQRDTEALAERRKCFADFADYGSHRGYTLARVSQTVQLSPLGQ
jgi:hypothetical protein